MPRIDDRLSREVARAVAAKTGGRAANAAAAFLQCGDRLGPAATYVEGFWRIGGQLDLHAWIEVGDRIVDPTMTVYPHLHLTGPPMYHPIVKYSAPEIRARLAREAYVPGTPRELELTWSDPRVQEAEAKLEPWQ